MKSWLMTVCFVALALSADLAQRKVPPPPKPADEGPTLEVTMKFIQDKMNEHGKVGYVSTPSGGNGMLIREYVLISGVVADASTCVLRASEKTISQYDAPEGTKFFEGGKEYNGHREMVDASTTPLEAVDSITVESAQDAANRRIAEAAHADIALSYAPAVYELSLKAAKKGAFSFHRAVSLGAQPPENSDFTDKENKFIFRDEETANRVAKAMVHAVELCGGGSKPEPF